MKIQKIIKSLKHYNRTIAAIATILLAILGVSVFIFSEEDNGISAAAKELSELSGNIRQYYQARPDYWGLNTQTVIDKKIYPEQMLKNGKLVGFMGNTVLVGSGIEGTMLMPGARNFDVVYKGLSSKQCVGLGSHKFEQKFWLGVSGVSILSDNQETLFDWDDKNNRLPISKAQAKKSCGKSNTIIWHF